MAKSEKKIVGLIIVVILVAAVCASVYYTAKIAREKRALLHSFAITNVGLLQQKENIEMKNDHLLNDFMNEVIINPKDERRKVLRDNAVQVAKLSKQMNDYIEVMKIELIEMTDGCDKIHAQDRAKNPFKVSRKGNYKSPDKFFGTENPPGNDGKAHDLKLQLETYRTSLLSFVTGEYVKKEMEKKLSMLNPDASMESGHSWEMFFFYHQPLMGALVELTRYQIIVREAENEMLDYLWRQIAAATFKFDAVMAVIIPKSTSVSSGSPFEADIVLAAYSSHVKPDIIYGTSVDPMTGEVAGGVHLPDEKFSGGKGHISIPTSGTGSRTCAGVVQIVNPITGQVTPYMFSTNYTVTSK